MMSISATIEAALYPQLGLACMRFMSVFSLNPKLSNLWLTAIALVVNNQCTAYVIAIQRTG